MIDDEYKPATTWVNEGVVIDKRGATVTRYQTFLAWIKRGKVEFVPVKSGNRTLYLVSKSEINRLRMNAGSPPI